LDSLHPLARGLIPAISFDASRDVFINLGGRKS
jgi:hypothetical protein